MVLQTERYNGGYQQQSYSSYQGPNGGYRNFQGVTEYTSPYSGSFQVSTYPSSHGPHHQSGWSSGGDYYGNGPNHYSGGGMLPHPVKPITNTHPVKPATNDYESSCYESSYTHGSPKHHGYGSTYGQGHGSPHHQGHGSAPLGFGKTQGFGGAITNQINKLTNGYTNYGSGSPNHHGHGSPNHHGHGSPDHHGHGRPNHHGHGSPDHHGHGSPYGSGKTQGFGGAITNQINKMTHGHNTYGSGGPNYGGHNPSGFNHGYQQHQPTWTVKGLDDDE